MSIFKSLKCFFPLNLKRLRGGCYEGKGFTLLELIVVIIIIGILATLGFSQYAKQVEYARLAEAKAMIGSMRKLVYEYYLKNGVLDGIQNSDVGVNDTCMADSFYAYWVESISSTCCNVGATRCTDGGKTPTASKGYYYILQYCPDTGHDAWYCKYAADGSSCFGLPP